MEIFIIFACLTLFGIMGYGFQIVAVSATLKKKKPSDHPYRRGTNGGSCIMNHECMAPVSVLKPLKGLDDNLFDNLESLCMQDYPEYEIIFALQDHNDPAYKVARKIKDKYPYQNIAIIVGKCTDGLNPKVNNLIPAYRYAQYEHILISDSNVMVGRDYLRTIMQSMQDPDVGLVSNMIKGIGGRTLGSVFENLHLNSFIMGSVCFLERFLRMPCVVGKSMLMKKEDLEAIGGLRAVKDVLAEDYIIGKMMHEKGKKIILSNYLIQNINNYWGIRKFINRHTRWGKLRWKIGGVKYVSELIGNAVFMSALPVLLWEPSRITITFALLISTLKVLGDLYIGKKIRSDMKPFLYILSPIKDLIIGCIWFVPILSNTVAWRGNRYIIGKNSLLSPAPETGIGSWGYRLIYAIKTRLA